MEEADALPVPDGVAPPVLHEEVHSRDEGGGQEPREAAPHTEVTANDFILLRGINKCAFQLLRSYERHEVTGNDFILLRGINKCAFQLLRSYKRHEVTGYW